ncbi:hypothetical protein ACFWHR_04735 [Leucobacter sp. NPDC058333]|uniref:hypothetical protein n=1 Tax=Leucobacter sp. NPDC058333 TaxID=3346450 RepID=UPI0036463762
MFIEVYSQPHDGPETLDGLPIVLQSAEDAKALGQAVLDALERSTFEVISAPDPRNNPMLKKLLTWAGVRNWASYAKGSKSVGVFSRYSVAPPATINITPEKWDSDGGFSPIMEERQVEVPFVGVEELGALLQDAMKLART